MGGKEDGKRSHKFILRNALYLQQIIPVIFNTNNFLPGIYLNSPWNTDPHSPQTQMLSTKLFV